MTEKIRTDGNSLDYMLDAAVRLKLEGTGDNHLTTVGASGGDVVQISNCVINKTRETVATNTTIDDTHDVVFVNTTSGDITITLPAVASARKHLLTIVNAPATDNGYKVTIDGNASELIHGNTTLELLNARDTVRIVHNGTEWFIV